MNRVATCVIFIILCVNVSQLSAEDVTSSKQIDDSSKTSTEVTKSDADVGGELKKDVTIDDNVTTKDIAKDKAKTEKSKGHKNKSNIITGELIKLNITDLSNILVNEDDLVKSLLNESELMEDDEKLNSTVRQGHENCTEETNHKSHKRYLTRLTSNLLAPILKARYRIDKAFRRTSKGLREVGGGTYDAAAGSFKLLTSAASSFFIRR